MKKLLFALLFVSFLYPMDRGDQQKKYFVKEQKENNRQEDSIEIEFSDSEKKVIERIDKYLEERNQADKFTMQLLLQNYERAHAEAQQMKECALTVHANEMCSKWDNQEPSNSIDD